MIERKEQSATSEVNRLRAVRRSGLTAANNAGQFDALADLAADLTGAPVALVSIVDDQRQFFVGRHGDVGGDSRSTPLHQSVCRTVVDDDTALSIDDLGADPAFADHAARRELGVEAYCGVPIRDPDGHVLGSFCVVDDSARQWSPETTVALQRLASIVGDWIRLAHRHGDLVSDLQAQLVPIELEQPTTGTLEARYRAVLDSGRIGGDFFDSRRRDDGGLDIVVGDIVGHGLNATQAAMQLRAAARTLLADSWEHPADFVDRLSDAATELDACDCAAIIALRIDADGRTVHWSRAGAMPPIFIGDGTASIDERSPGPPLGLPRPPSLTRCTRVLEKGGGFLAFTDGLVEDTGTDIDHGLNELTEVLPHTDDIDEIIDRVCRQERQSDDLAIVHYRMGSALG